MTSWQRFLDQAYVITAVLTIGFALFLFQLLGYGVFMALFLNDAELLRPRLWAELVIVAALGITAYRLYRPPGGLPPSAMAWFVPAFLAGLAGALVIGQAGTLDAQLAAVRANGGGLGDMLSLPLMRASLALSAAVLMAVSAALLRRSLLAEAERRQAAPGGSRQARMQ